MIPAQLHLGGPSHRVWPLPTPLSFYSQPAHSLCFLSGWLEQQPIQWPRQELDCCLIILSFPRLGPLPSSSSLLFAAVTQVLAPPFFFFFFYFFFGLENPSNLLLAGHLFLVLLPLNPLLPSVISIVCEMQMCLCCELLSSLPWLLKPRIFNRAYKVPSWTGPAYPFSLFSMPLLLPPALCISDILICFHLQVCSLFFLLPVFCTCCPLILERWAVTSSGKPSMTSNTWIKYSFLSVPFLCTLESLTSQSNYCTALEFVFLSL